MLQDQSFKFSEAAELTKMSVSWLRKMVACGKIAQIKKGRNAFIPKEEIERINSGLVTEGLGGGK